MKNKIIIFSLIIVVLFGSVYLTSDSIDDISPSTISYLSKNDKVNITPEMKQVLSKGFENNIHRYPCILPRNNRFLH